MECVGWRQALEAPVPTLGCRELLRWEADQHKKMELLKLAGIPTPRIYMSPEEVEGPVIVKLFGAKGGRGYFLARNKEELAEGARRGARRRSVTMDFGFCSM